MALQVPTGTMGSVQQLAARPGEVWALIANQYVLYSVGGRFNEVRVYSTPIVDLMQLSGSGAAAITVFNTLSSCLTNCEGGANFDDFGFPGSMALCGSADYLGVMTRTPDAGAALYEQTPTSWNLVSKVNIRSPLDCARTTRGELFVAGTGAVAAASDGGFSLEIPDVSALGRVSANEAWSKIGTDGTSVFAASVRGAVASRPEAGGWTVATALPGEISALAVESANEVWVVGTGAGLARFDGTQWRAAGLGPTQLTSFEALALESSHVYVGGRDAAGVARIFRRLR